MEAPRTTLNVHLPWPHTAALLGLALAHDALPARTTCPLCGRRRLHVYEDTPCGGAWFCCPDCGRCGDLVELAAAVWGLGLPAALARLARLGAPLPAEALDPERVADYVRDYPGYRRRLGALGEGARSVQVGGRTVVERADGWYAVGKSGREVQLVNAVLRIDTVVTEGEALHYRGRILFGGQEVPYAVPAEVVQRHPARWLREFLLRQGQGVLHFAPGVSGLVEMALKFQEPALG